VVAPLSVHLARISLLLRNAIRHGGVPTTGIGLVGIRIPKPRLQIQRLSFGESHFRTPVQSSLTSLPERFLGVPREKLFRTSRRQPLPNRVKSGLLVIQSKSPRIRVILFYPGVLTPFLSISMAFPNLFNRVSSFLASVIQRQYCLRWV
jgi:hypothetical protein